MLMGNDYYDVTGGYKAPIMRPDEVKGNAAHASVQPDRFFYLLDESTGNIWEVDGYLKDDGSGGQYWELLIKCPKCGNNLRLDSRKKPIEVSDRGIETGEPIHCTYFIDQDGYRGWCPWGAEWKPPKKTMIIPMTDNLSGRPGLCKIDAIIKKA